MLVVSGERWPGARLSPATLHGAAHQRFAVAHLLGLEFAPSEDRTALLLAFPIVVGAVHAMDRSIDLFAEPQLQTCDNAGRVLFGTRLTLLSGEKTGTSPLPIYRTGAFVEGGGLLGQDGHGWTIGAGLTLGDWELASIGGLAYRVSRVSGHTRHDISVDLVRLDLRGLVGD